MLRTVLRLALFQLFWMDRIPDHAAVHESVEMVKNAGYGQQAGFINAVLRSYLREEGPTREQLAALKQTQPAIGYSHPEWLAKRWTERWGAEAAAALMGWDNIPP
jgi:16S rRNA (cytosine967-C5)-methyltransferase